MELLEVSIRHPDSASQTLMISFDKHLFTFELLRRIERFIAVWPASQRFQ